MKAPRILLRKPGRRFSALVAALCCGVTLSLMAQAAWTVAARPPQDSAGGQRGEGAPAQAPFVATGPVTCESFATLVDTALVDWQGMRETYVIFIARPGAGEQAGLNKGRLRDLTEYLKRYKAIKYVAAEAEQVEGPGRIEIYVGGKLLTVIPVEKNAATVCSGKVNPLL